MKIHALKSISIPRAYRSLKSAEAKMAKEPKNSNLSTQGVKVSLCAKQEMKPEEANYLRYGGSLEEILKADPTTAFLQALEEVASPLEMIMYGLGPYRYIPAPSTKT